jgi:hypothetical protein
MRVQRGDKVFDVRVTLSALQPAPDEEEGPPRMPPLMRP